MQQDARAGQIQEAAAGSGVPGTVASLSPRAASLFGGLSRSSDLLLVALTGVLAFVLRHESIDLPDFYWPALLAGLLVHQMLANLLGAYDFARPGPAHSQSASTVAAWLATFAILALVGYLLKLSELYSRGWALLWLLLGGTSMVVLRALLFGAVQRVPGLRPPPLRVLLVGDRAGCARIEARLRDSAAQLHIAGCIEPRDLQGLAQRWRGLGADEIILAGPVAAAEAPDMLRALRDVPARVRCCFEPAIEALVMRAGRLGDVPMLELFPAPVAGPRAVLKRGEDLALGAMAALVAVPLLLVAAIAIRADSPGPILFRQTRQGFGGDRFTMYKLRTMRVAAAAGEAASLATSRGDDRVTPVGRMLRRLSIDELPQLWNVLRGEMSLVGPRPHAAGQDEAFASLIEGYALRRRMQPGMTGWAQVNGRRGELRDRADLEQRLQLDLDYIEHWSLGFDLWILLLTAVRLPFDRNAY